MWLRVRTLLVKMPTRIAFGLVAAYFLFAWFGFEPLLKWAAPKYITAKSQHTLSLDSASFDPLALSLDIKGLKLALPDGKPLLAFAELFVDFDASSLWKRAYVFQDIRLVAPHAWVELRPDGSLNWNALLAAFKSKDDEPDKPLPRLLIRQLSLEKGRVEVTDRKVAGGFSTVLAPLDIRLSVLSTLPDDKGAYTLAATTQQGARIRWKGALGLKPIAASGELGVDRVTLARLWPYAGAKLNLAPPSGTAAMSLHYRLGYADGHLSLSLDRLDFSLEGLGLRGKAADHDALFLNRLALRGGHFDLDRRQLDLGEIALSGGRVVLSRDRAGHLDVMDWLPAPAHAATPAAPVAGPDALTPEAQGGGEPWRVSLARFSLDALGVRVRDAGFATPLDAEIGNTQLSFSAHVEAGGPQTQALLDELGVSLSDLRLSAGKKSLFALGSIRLEGGRIDLAARTAQVGRVALANGKVEVLRDAHGGIALLDALKPVAAIGSPARAGVAQSDAPPWHYRVGSVGLSGFQIGLRDESVRPAGGLTLQGIEANAEGLSENLKTSLPVKLAFQVKEGGRFQAEGKLVPARPSADIRLKLDGLALAPVQPWLGQAANLLLADGRLSTQGRVRYDAEAGADRQVGFTGGFSVDGLLLNEGDTGTRFLAWKQLSSDTVSATPAGLDIGLLRLAGLDAKLIINPDKSTNLKKILRGAETTQAKPTQVIKPTDLAKPAPSVASGGGAGSEGKNFRVNIDRVRVAGGGLDFADLSLKLPFGTHIHDLEGTLDGLSNQPGRVAQLELDGQVDEYGLARAAGQVNLFDPTGFMDIKTVFKNVEMTNLTPYTATFAGYKVASGKLSLNLEYKIKQRQLQGENQVILDKLILGERLEGPDIQHLPLELAIALLKDADGRIDLGLPVSGSLDDPQFSYGRIIWKAIGNVLTKIVTSPFRALASLFGGSGEKLESLAFEPGEAGLTPPEKEKFKQLAQILGKRPGLALTVHGAWGVGVDRPLLKARQLRRGVAGQMGLKLAPDEDAGPISTANPKVAAALESLYAARIGDTAWKSLQARWLQANPGKTSGTGKMMSRLKGLFKQEEALSVADRGALAGADLHALLYDRLLEREEVSDAVLKQLAVRRAQAVVAGLVAAGAPSERVQTGAIEAYPGDGQVVPAKLELGVAVKR